MAIVNYAPANKPVSVLDEIRQHPYLQFHLTGSRFFGGTKIRYEAGGGGGSRANTYQNAIEVSDWDFFIENQDEFGHNNTYAHNELFRFLMSNGFVQVGFDYGPGLAKGFPEEFIGDPTIQEVWENKKENIHVQVIRKGKMEMKKKAQTLIKEGDLLREAKRHRLYGGLKIGGITVQNSEEIYKTVAKSVWRFVFQFLEQADKAKRGLKTPYDGIFFG